VTTREERKAMYSIIIQEAKALGPAFLRQALRQLALNDLFFLLVYVCKRSDIDRDFLFDRCREVNASPDGMLDLWAREHYKSTIITFGLTIQDILHNPELTVGIFSHTKPIARAFLRQIKYELENNDRLKDLFPEVLYQNPRQESSNWSEDKGITVIRKTNPKEATIEAHGLVDGQPTSKHFGLLIYDDVVTRESVTSPEMINKTTEAWELSLNLGSHGGRVRYIGTRYHFNDTWGKIISRKTAVARIHPATDDGKPEGKPVFLTKEELVKKRRDMGSYVFACQMLQDPKADEAQGFKQEWLRFWEPANWQEMNRYIVVDPANAKRKMNDYTSMWVFGLGRDKKYYIIDLIRDRLNLTERTKALFDLHEMYEPIGVGYEHYGMQADIQHIEFVQNIKNYRFDVTPLGGQIPKNDRIRGLIPLFEEGRIYIPKSLVKVTLESRATDLIEKFINDEFVPFPVSAHDDMLDCMARILHPDLMVEFPKEQKSPKIPLWKQRIRQAQSSQAA